MKYPRNCAYIKNDAFVLSADDSLKIPTAEEMENGKRGPLFAHSKFSVFKIALVQNGVASVTANIPGDVVNGIYLKTEAAIALDMQESMKLKPKEVLSPAYTALVKSKLDQLANKTPAAIMINTPEAIPDLVKHRDWLATQVSNPKNAKYKEGNEKQLNAINEAFGLYNAQALNPDAVDNNATIVLYDVPMKVPSKSTLDENGNTFVYGITISYTLGVPNPYKFEVYNCMAPPTNGVGAQMSKAANMKKFSISASYEQGTKFISNLQNRVKEFEMMNASYLRSLSDQEYNRQKAEHKAQQTQIQAQQTLQYQSQY